MMCLDCPYLDVPRKRARCCGDPADPREELARAIISPEPTPAKPMNRAERRRAAKSAPSLPLARGGE